VCHSRTVSAVAGVGLGPAVPVNATTRRIVAALLADGRVRRAYVGVVGSPALEPTAVAGRYGRCNGLRPGRRDQRQPRRADRSAGR
jgi:S1-C subfamily serine protease